MEAGAGMEGIRVRMDGIERRTDAIHDGLGAVRGQVADQKTNVKVMRTEMANVSEDIAELKGQMRWVLRGLWLAAATFTTLTVSLAVLIVSVINSG